MCSFRLADAVFRRTHLLHDHYSTVTTKSDTKDRKNYIKWDSKGKEEDKENGEEGLPDDTYGEPMPERQGEKGDGVSSSLRERLSNIKIFLLKQLAN